MTVRRSPDEQLPNLRTIRELLKTWHVRQLQGVRIPHTPDEGLTSEWSWEYEKRYGEPNLSSREVALRDGLELLANRGTEVGPVVQALTQAKHQAFETALRGLTLDLQREQVEEADRIRRSLLEWLPRAIRLHRQLDPDDEKRARRFRMRFEQMLTSLTFDQPITDRDKAQRDWLFAPRPQLAKQRRPTRGNPDGPVVKTAKALLAAAKVPHQQRLPLLWAIGLVQEDGSLHRRRNLIRK